MQQSSRKRQRDTRYCCCCCCPAEEHTNKPSFLPTHLSLLRSLHADDATEAGGGLADVSCPRPSWVEINNFLVLRASIMKRESKARRTRAILGTLLPSPTANTPATSSPVSHAAALPAGTAQQQRQRGPGIEQSRPLLDPRAVVHAVLRNAVRDREAEHLAASARLRGLKKSVDDTVNHLSSSLDGLRRNRRDRAKPWSNSEEDEGATHAADVVERHHSKVLLWRRLQKALVASRVGVDEE